MINVIEDGYNQAAAKFRIAGKQNDGVAFEDLEECVKKASEDCPTQVIHVGPPAQSFDPVSTSRGVEESNVDQLLWHQDMRWPQNQ